MSASGSSLVDAVVRSFKGALASIDLAARVRECLPPAPPARARVRVVAVGKAALPMVAGALQRWPGRIEHALVVVPDGAGGAVDPPVEVVRASHPIPDHRSVLAAERALSLAAGQARDLLLALVSGGASALLCAPSTGLSLLAKQEATLALLRSGARIHDINTVRRHMSRIKGGGLTRAAYPGRVLTLLVSDVIEGGASDIGSGPTVPDGSTVHDARGVLARYAATLPPMVLTETLKEGEAPARRQRARVIAGPSDVLASVVALLRAEGLLPRLAAPSTAEVKVLADEYAGLVRAMRPGEAIVRSAEPTLALPPSGVGRGGRAGHLAALVARELPPGAVFLSGATDGTDGLSGAAGAVVDADFVAHFDGVRYDKALSGFDTARLHEEAKTALELPPTGQNFADLHILALR